MTVTKHTQDPPLELSRFSWSTPVSKRPISSKIQLTNSVPIEKEVVIIGNGPSSLTMGFLLQGHLPYYIGGQTIHNHYTPPHPDTSLHNKLLSYPKGTPLLNMYLKDLAHNYNQTGSTRVSDPIARLLDNLAHPLADIDPDEPTRLGWRKVRPATPHIILGKDAIGGVWGQLADSDMKALSHHSHLELPGLTFTAWRQSLGLNNLDWRPTRKEVAQYYQYYTKWAGINRNCRTGTEVLQIQPITKGSCCCPGYSNICQSYLIYNSGLTPCNKCSEFKYIIRGIIRSARDPHHIKKFAIRTNHVILATGSYNVPIPLKVPGETLPGVFNDARTMVSSLPTQDNSPVLVVGSGLSAADAILNLKRQGRSIIHVFYSPSSYPRSNRPRHPLATCWKDEYPEYHSIYQLMKGQSSSQYEGFSDGQLVQLDSIGTTSSLQATLRASDGTIHRRILSRAVILVGRRPNLNILINQPLPSPPTWDSTSPTTLHSIGSLAGSSFVRHILPTCLLTSTFISSNQ